MAYPNVFSFLIFVPIFSNLWMEPFSRLLLPGIGYFEDNSQNNIRNLLFTFPFHIGIRCLANCEEKTTHQIYSCLHICPFFVVILVFIKLWCGNFILLNCINKNEMILRNAISCELTGRRVRCDAILRLSFLISSCKISVWYNYWH